MTRGSLLDRVFVPVAFTPRGGSRWLRLLTGDVSRSPVTRTDRLVVVLPDIEEDEEDG